MIKHSFKNRVVVITGASSGIGLSVAKVLASLQAKLFLIARQSDKLEETRKMLMLEYGRELFVRTFAMDIGIDSENVHKAITRIGEENGGIDLLINNAGILRCGRFGDLIIEDFEKTMQSNYMGALYVTKAAWKYVAMRKGNVSFVCSVAGYIGLTGYTAYSPTKFAMTALAECLRMEGKRDGIKVTIIYPGDTNTPLLAYEHVHAPPETREVNKGVKVREPDYVANKLVDGIVADKYEVYCDTSSNFYRKLKGIFPWLFYRSIDAVARKANVE